MKKLISLLTASALMLGLAACGDFAPDPTASQETALDFEYTEESFPEVWAGRSAAPLMEAVAAIMLGTGRAEGAERISFAATDEVWAALGRGEAALAVPFTTPETGVCCLNLYYRLKDEDEFREMLKKDRKEDEDDDEL